MGTHFERAQVLVNLGRPVQAAEELRRELAENIDNCEAHRLLAWCLARQDQLPEAQAEAEEAIRLQPNYDHAYRTLAWILESQRRWEEAEKALREAIRINPHDADHFFFLASLFSKQNRWEENEEAAREGLQIDPDSLDCANNLVKALIQMNRLDEAQQVMKSVMTKHPENALAHVNQAWIYLLQGKHKVWLPHMLEAARISPKACIDEAIQTGKSERERKRALYWGYGIGIAICIIVIALFRLFGQQK